MAVSDSLSPSALGTLLCGYAGQHAARHRLLWLFDARLVQLVRTTSEPLIGQMRIAWWEEALTDPKKGKGEPLLDALRKMGVADAPGLRAMLDGWEALLGDAVLDGPTMQQFALGRGGGLFRALAGEEPAPDWLISAGQLWALWDLSGHVRGEADRAAAIELARAHLPALEGVRWPRGWKPLRLATELARHDVIRGRVAPSTLTPRIYVRLLRLAFTKR